MAGIDIYGSKGLSRFDYRNDLAKLEGFCAIESDWKELFRWIISAGGCILKEKNEGSIPLDLWQNHILTVLVDIIQKDIQSYRETFIQGRGTSKQGYYVRDMREKIESWIKRIDNYLLFTRCDGTATERNSAIQAAVLIKAQLQESLEYETPTETSLRMEVENMPYYRMLEAIHEIKEKHTSYIQMIEDNGDMDASLALLLTFIRHYCSISKEFNNRLASLAAFYRKDILGAAARPARQDTTFVLLTPVDSTMEFGLPAGTQFSAGTKPDGTELLYETVKNESITGIQLESVRMLFPTQNKAGEVIACNETVEFNTPSVITPLFPAVKEGATPVESGWRIESPVLLLKEGARKIGISFRLTEETAAMLKKNMYRYSCADSVFDLQISSCTGWISRQKAPVTFLEENGTCSLKLSFNIDKKEPAVTACNEEIHHTTTSYPVVRILTRYINSLYEWIESVRFNSIHITVEAADVRSVTLSNEFGELDLSQPFYPFGHQAEVGSYFMFGCEELCHKQWTKVALNGVWNKLPMTPYGYTDIYKDYPGVQTITNDSFLIYTEWQGDGQWNKCPETPSQLFHSPNGKPVEEAGILFKRCPPNDMDEVIADCTGNFRVRLVSGKSSRS